MKALIIGVVVAAVVIAIAGILIVNSLMTTSPVEANQGGMGNIPTDTNTTTTSPPEEPGRIILSTEPVYRERAPPGAATPINQTHISAEHSGNGILTLPNGTQINTTSSGTAILSFPTSSADATSTIRAENGEAMTATIHEIIQFNDPAAAPQGGGRGILTAILHTNSTGSLAPFDGMILAGTDIIYPNGETDTQMWRWESGIPLSTNSTSATSGANVTAADND
jgi:hypothetical protein